MIELFKNHRRNFSPPRADWRSAGFSIIETIVAITILIVAVVGPLTIAQKSLASASYSKDQVAAAYLAEEGVEFVEYVRSDNALQGKSWLNSLDSCVDNDGSGAPRQCGIDPSAPGSVNGNQIIDCGGKGGRACELYFNSGTGVYGHRLSAGFNKTKFTRKIHITTSASNGSGLLAGAEAAVSSVVSWPTPPFGSQTITTVDYLTNWKAR
jgi:type II secretory pathway pseudopilin PulG